MQIFAVIIHDAAQSVAWVMKNTEDRLIVTGQFG